MSLPPDHVITAIKESVLLPLLLTVFERDKSIIEASAIKTKRPYLAAIDRAAKAAHADLVATKRLLAQSGARVYDERRTAKDVSVKYSVRGFQSDAVYLWDYLRAEIEVRMMRYLNGNEDVTSG